MKRKKIVIDNKSDLGLYATVQMILDVIKTFDKEKDKQNLPFLSHYHIEGKKYLVVFDINKKSEKLIVYNDGKGMPYKQKNNS